MILNALLKLKGWMLSALIIVPIVAVTALSRLELNGKLVIILTTYCTLVLAVWMISMGPSLIRRVRSYYAKSEKLFLMNVGFISCFFLCVTILEIWKTAAAQISVSGIVVLGFSCYALFAIIHASLSFARSLVSVEINAKARFGQTLFTLLELWLFPIGIAFVHNRIRKLP